MQRPIKISDLPEVEELKDESIFSVVQDGTNKKAKIAKLKKDLGLAKEELTKVVDELTDDFKENLDVSIDKINALPSRSEVLNLLYQQTLANLKGDVDLTDIEKEYSAELISQRNGKVYGTEFYKFATNSTSTGTRLLDSVGKECSPSTDSVVGKDDFLNDSIIFAWKRCNYKRDDDSTARLVALQGSPAFRTSGSVDVGTISATFYWKYEDNGETYRIYMSDSPNHALGLVPWIDAVKADGKVLPYYIISSYASVTAEDGLLRSQPDIYPAYNQSYNNMITNYQKKGAGYWGAGASRTLHAILFYYIKYADKNSQKYFAGCTNFDVQAPCEIAENDVKRVLTTNTSFYKGCCVSVGTGAKAERGNATCNDIVDRAKVTNIETVTVSGKDYNALYLDITDSINTLTSYYITSMPCISGETDNVIGNYDGSYLSNTNSRHTYRIHGVEYNNGQYFVEADTVLDKVDDYWNVYVAQKGTKHVANAHTNYVLSGKIPANKDSWMGDLYLNENGSWTPATYGGGSSIGTGDYLYAGGQPTNGTLREKIHLGRLGSGSLAGLSCVYCWNWLSVAAWDYASCD